MLTFCSLITVDFMLYGKGIIYCYKNLGSEQIKKTTIAFLKTTSIIIANFFFFVINMVDIFLSCFLSLNNFQDLIPI